MPKTIDIECAGYSVKTDIYGEDNKGPIVLSLIGRTSRRKKQHYIDFAERLSKELDATSIVFDYSGHGDSPLDFDTIRPAQHFLEVIEVFDWVKQQYPNRKFIVIGSSYGGYLATQLTQYREFDVLVLRAPAIYRPADFYTKAASEDKESTMSFRKDADKLASHPLVARTSKFKGKVLLIVHEYDELIPHQTTDAYAKAFNADVILEKGITHSLDTATVEQVKLYFDDIYGWLSKQ
jgi:hypothetical protein